MPIEPPRRITETQIIKREENATLQQRKKQAPKKKGPQQPDKPGKVDIKI